MASVAAAAVALVEDQVDDGEHGGQPVGEQVGGGDPERDPGGLDLRLRAHQALGHGRVTDQEGAGDLLGAQAAEGAKRQRHLGVERERRMAAGEDELEALVRDLDVLEVVFHGLGPIQELGLGGEGAVAAQPVDGAVAGRRQQPGARAGGGPFARPALRGDRERLLGGLLGEVEVAEEADQVGEDESPVVAEGLLEARYHSTTGRTSIAPPMRAAGIREASSIAASRSSASNTR